MQNNPVRLCYLLREDPQVYETDFNSTEDALYWVSVMNSYALRGSIVTLLGVKELTA